MSSKWMAAIALPAMPAAADVAAETVIAEARERLTVSDEECTRSGREIVVCAPYNENDRYRLPLETVEPGDPDDEGVWSERARLQANPGTCQGWAFFKAMCGGVGVSAGIGGDGPSLGGGMRTAD
ncbi:MAG: hypothetical protein LC634_00540 [Sphingomonadales bacterium]|nr:hypothetical protein [Sphingomonadales bacterium]